MIKHNVRTIKCIHVFFFVCQVFENTILMSQIARQHLRNFSIRIFRCTDRTNKTVFNLIQEIKEDAMLVAWSADHLYQKNWSNEKWLYTNHFIYIPPGMHSIVYEGPADCEQWGLCHVIPIFPAGSQSQYHCLHRGTDHRVQALNRVDGSGKVVWAPVTFCFISHGPQVLEVSS